MIPSRLACKPRRTAAPPCTAGAAHRDGPDPPSRLYNAEPLDAADLCMQLWSRQARPPTRAPCPAGRRPVLNAHAARERRLAAAAASGASGAASHGDGQLHGGRQHQAVALLHAPAAAGPSHGRQRRRFEHALGAASRPHADAPMSNPVFTPPAEKKKKMYKAHRSKWKVPCPVPTRLSSHT